VHGPDYFWHPRWWERGAQPRNLRRGCGVQSSGFSPAIFFDDFLSMFGKHFLIFKNIIIGNTEFEKPVPYVTARPNSLRPSRREVKNDVWKYLQIIVIGLCAVCGHLLDNQDRALNLLVDLHQFSIPIRDDVKLA